VLKDTDTVAVLDRIMEKLGYGPDKRLPLKVSARNLNSYRDPAVIAIDQLKEVYIDGVCPKGRRYAAGRQSRQPSDDRGVAVAVEVASRIYA
jgi:hypothetical protein